MSSRPFDLVLWGATGFTGQLVAAYLLKNANCRWAMAGRNQSKLEKLRTNLGAEAQGVPILTADSHDEKSLSALCAQSRVVISTVGPYWQHGSKLVASCVLNKTHYVDLTGETPWVREMIDAHHETASQKKIKIVHFCGFDSIPSDLGVLALQNDAKAASPLKKISLYVGPIKGGLSGGTIASMLGTISRVKEKKVRRVLGNPYALNPDPKLKGRDGPDQMTLRWDEQYQFWTAPFVMASVNTRVVRRTHSLHGMPYGDDFQYREVTAFPKGFRGWRRAATLTFGLTTVLGLMAVSPTRWLLKRFFFPKPGEGPSADKRDGGYFRILLEGEAENGEMWHCLVTGDKDPGYGQTAVMLAESALALVHNFDSLPETHGVLTPASGLGMPLVERLRASGMRFQTGFGKGSFSIK